MVRPLYVLTLTNPDRWTLSNSSGRLRAILHGDAVAANTEARRIAASYPRLFPTERTD